MRKRGRKSGAELTLVSAVGIEETIRRPTSPADLSAEQSEEWRAVVNRLQADWFPRETHAVLAQFCRHTVAARLVAQRIDASEAPDEPSDGCIKV